MKRPHNLYQAGQKQSSLTKVFKYFKYPGYAAVFFLLAPLSGWRDAGAPDQGNGAGADYGIKRQGDTFRLLAGLVELKLNVKASNIIVESLRCDGRELLAAPSKGVSMEFASAYPNVEPEGVRTTNQVAGSADLELDEGDRANIISGKEDLPVGDFGNVKWVDPVQVSGSQWHGLLNHFAYSLSNPRKGVWRLNLRARADNKGALDQVAVNQYYEVYEGYPVVRKWVEVSNNSARWLRIDNLLISDIELSEEYTNETVLAVQHGGVRSSVVSFSNKDVSNGVIAVSEAPSGTKDITARGGMGYASEHFEWVVGPTEKFVSEPVFYYGFGGDVYKTSSAVSTPLDRALERDYIRFLEDHIGIRANPKDLMSPSWCSWNNFGADINDAVIREMADIAAQAGLKSFIIDAGYQGGSEMTSWFSTAPNPERFPDFKATCDYVRSRGLQLGLWVTSSRLPGTEDRRVVPDGLARWWTPERHKDGYAMSYTSKWRDYYINDLVRMHDVYGITYYKQDLRSMGYGDIAYGHSARTLKESVLRQFRGFFETQDEVRRLAPDVKLENTHENYWRIKAPVDLATLKHSDFMFIPMQNYLGDGKWRWKDRQTGYWEHKPELMQPELVEACYIATERFYENRGLPVYALEHHGASMVNFDNCLTREIQDLQICSWLMGSLKFFTGDLATLSKKNIRLYRERFEMVEKLNEKYGIMRYFQFSGVPGPSRKDWFWWGKLNDVNGGVVVVIRGDGGEEERAINVPWVKDGHKYKVKSLIGGRELGEFDARSLRDGVLKLRISKNNGEILELERI